MTLFFHIFKIQGNPNHANGYGLFFLRIPIRYSEAYFESRKDIVDLFYPVTFLTKEAHAKICRLGPYSPSACSDMFHKY